MKNLKDFGKRMYSGFRDSTLGIFAYPTYKKNQDFKETLTFGEEIVEDAVSACVIPFGVGSALAFPHVVLPAALVSNAVSYFIERNKSKSEKFSTKKRSFVYGLKKRIASTILAGAVALSVNCGLQRAPFRGEDNLNLVECEYTDSLGESRKMYVLGEIHNYNKTSSNLAKSLNESLDFDAVYREGPDFTGSIPLEERLLILGLKPFVSGAGLNEDSFLKYCDSKVPVFPLEKYDETGGREGLGIKERVALGVVGVGAMVYAPSTYFASLPFRSGSIPKIGFGKSGENIIKKRDEKMTHAVLKYLREGKGQVPIIVIGNQHVPGVLENLSQELGPTFKSEYLETKLTE